MAFLAGAVTAVIPAIVIVVAVGEERIFELSQGVLAATKLRAGRRGSDTSRTGDRSPAVAAPAGKVDAARPGRTSGPGNGGVRRNAITATTRPTRPTRPLKMLAS
ncbi:hypothetical protein [Nonomuraea dietziae]|uniref:hypothetical protein n=1 Tax=Nonomuraea dietziae TaxID=65515 RepID=UPI003411A0C4